MNAIDTGETGRCRFCNRPDKRLFDIYSSVESGTYAIARSLCDYCVKALMPKDEGHP